MSDLPTPKVFISYSWTSDAHVAWVVVLAEKLVADGVDVVLDQWDLKEGHDKYVFMEQMVTDGTVNRVLAICDKRYAAKADGREGGVGTESQIISKDIYDKVKQEKFIPLLRERNDDGSECVPVFFRNRKYIDFSNDDTFGESYDRLLRLLFGRPELKKPALGNPPAYLLANTSVFVGASVKLERLKEAVAKEKPHRHAVLQEYLDTFVGHLDDFRIEYNRDSVPEFDDQVLESIERFLPYRDNFIDMMWFVASYMNDDESYDLLHAFLEKILPYKEPQVGAMSHFEVSTDNYRFILYELLLYLVAVLVKNRRYAVVPRFACATYHHTEKLGDARFIESGVGAFNDHIASLEEYRNRRLNLNRVSVTADTIVGRAAKPRINVPDLCQADGLLFLLGYGNRERSAESDWYPRCIVYCTSSGPLELFARATSPPGFSVLSKILGVKSYHELAGRIASALSDSGLAQHLRGIRFRGSSLENVFNLHAIGEKAKA
ncbi:hypothetical protein AYO40_00610 [Planctomycetaceae bacterium SCGC AG-212-D15]|nr:hypothetical protein AYO40_00610 [Planctomycetaceae bacterium SCGC AG-212-D15]